MSDADNFEWDNDKAIGVHRDLFLAYYQYKLSQSLIFALRVADICNWRSPIESHSERGIGIFRRCLMFSHAGAASVTFERRDRFQEELLPRSGHSPAREINTLSHLFHENARTCNAAPPDNL